MELIIINNADAKIFPELITSNKIKILERKPVKGGIPPIEKKITIKENDHNLFKLKKFVKLEINKEVEDLS
jgi:hypothetical protein